MAFEMNGETLESEPTEALLSQADRAAKKAEEQAERAALEALEAKALALMREVAALPSSKQRLDLLLDAPDIDALIPLMPAEQLFFTIQSVGLSDALELVHLSSAEQFVGFIDLDAWKRDELSVEKVITWLRAAGTDTNDDRFEQKLAALDIELLERLLQASVRIWDLEETPDPEPEGEIFRSPEGKYLLEFQIEGVPLAGLKRVLNLLYAQDPLKAARLVEAVRWEISAELEESAFRWRNARLADQGFPDLEEALSYFAFVDPNALLPTTGRPMPSSPIFSLSQGMNEARFFERALRLVPESDRETIEGELINLLNAIFVVEEIDPSAIDDVEHALERARDMLALGLEKSASGDPSLGAQLLLKASLKRIFQVGVSLGLKLKFRLDRFLRHTQIALPGVRETLLDAPYGQLIGALRRKRPLFIDWPEDEVGSQAALDAPAVPLRAFRTLADVARADLWISEIEQIAELMKSLGLELPGLHRQLIEAGLEAKAPFLRYSTLYATAIAREVSGAGFGFEPLPRSHLGDFGREAFERRPDGRIALKPGFAQLLSGKLRRRAVDFSPAHVATASRFAQRISQKLFDELAEPWALGTLEQMPELPLLLTN